MRKRLYLFLSIYFLFVFFLLSCLSPEAGIGTTILCMVFVYGTSFVFMVAACVVIEIAAGIAGFLFRVLGYDEYAESTVKSVRDAVGLVPALAVIIMIAIPAWTLHLLS